MSRDELVEKMLDAFYVAGVAAADTFPYMPDMRFHMAAALDVAVGELLRPVSTEELWHGDDRARFSELLSYRRAQLEKVKTPEERVTVERDGALYFMVYRDGLPIYGHITAENAEIYRLGLIAKLKEQAQ